MLDLSVEKIEKWAIPGQEKVTSGREPDLSSGTDPAFEDRKLEFNDLIDTKLDHYGFFVYTSTLVLSLTTALSKPPPSVITKRCQKSPWLSHLGSQRAD